MYEMSCKRPLIFTVPHAITDRPKLNLEKENPMAVDSFCKVS